jgi:hypothetical protein
MGVWIDHVLLGVADLDEAAHQLAGAYGLATSGGGRHPGWGTANLIVPLGDSYLELVTVVDPEEARTSDFGRWIASMLGDGPSTGWVVRTDDIAGTAHRLHLDVAEGSRRTASGSVLRWRLAGVGEAAASPWLPFFIEWEPGSPYPGAADVRHPVGGVSLRELRVAGDGAALMGWLGTDELPVLLSDGDAGPTAVVLATDAGDVVVRSPAAPAGSSWS